MAKPDIDEFVRQAEQLYLTHPRAKLEPEHIDEFVAIEPESGDYLLESDHTASGSTGGW